MSEYSYSKIEQKSRIELPSEPWQGPVIAIIRLLHGEGHVIYPFKGLPQTLRVGCDERYRLFS